MNNSLKIVLGGLMLVSLTAVLPLTTATGRVIAQTTNSSLIITWEANNYFPADFPGKAMITPGTPVTAAVEEIAGNKLVDLTGAQISWFINDKLAQNGTGLKSINFTASPDSNGLVTIRVTVQTPNNSLTDSVSILATAPFSVIDYPSLTNTLPAGGNVTLTAWPYFFNVRTLSQLTFTWQLNGQTIKSGNNQLLVQVNTPQIQSQQILPVILTTQNTQNPLEFSKNTSVFNIINGNQ
jgi:hypothetical protein